MHPFEQVREISTRDLVLATEQAENVQVLDIRAPDRIRAVRIEVPPPGRYLALPGSQIVAMDDPAGLGFSPDLPTVVVCDHGRSSRALAAWLIDAGFEALSLAGGMAAWMETLIPRRLDPPEGFDLLLQFDRPGKGSLAYLLAQGGEALLIDPPLRYEAMETALGENGLKLAGAVDTHLHADFISGSPGLSERHKVPYHLHPADHVFPYDRRPGRQKISPVGEGSEVPVGDASVLVLHTPGHTEGSITLMADGTAFTGDFIFVESVGRPDLAGRGDDWAPLLWESLERARSEWECSTRILPGHYGSEGERAEDRTIQGLLGELPERNAPLRIGNREDFLSWIEEREAAIPDAYRYIKAINAGLMDANDQLVERVEFGRNECAVT